MLTCVLQAAPSSPGPATPDASSADWTIAVVKDGDGIYFEKLSALVEKELDILTQDDVDVVFKTEPAFNAAWQPQRIDSVLEAALNDPEVDLVLAAGILVARRATEEDLPLSKPVVSGFVQDPDAVGLPYNADGRSTKKNFNFTVIPLRSTRDLEVFSEIVDFEHLAIAVDDILLQEMDSIDAIVALTEKRLNRKISLVPMATSAAELLDGIGPSVDAVYLTPPLRMTRAEWQQVIDGLNARKIPTFSLMGHPDVRRGALAGLAPEADTRLARRIALNIDQIMAGIPPEELRVPMMLDEQLMINAETAVAIDYAPSFEVSIEWGAEYINEEALDRGAPLALAQAIELALEQNQDMAVKEAEVRSSREDQRLALSTLLPQVEGNVTQSRIDRDRAEASFGLQPLERRTAGVSASQVLFNDPAFSAYRAAARLYRGSLHEQEATRLDTMEAAAKQYILFLQARKLLDIELDNLRLSRNNRDLARIRREVGAADPEEVYRWETEVAAQRATAIAAHSAMEQARIALNQVMGMPQSKRWLPADITLSENGYYLLEGRLETELKNDRDLAAFEAFLVLQALERSPLLEALDKSIEAQRITLNQARRRYIVPEVGVSFTYDHVLDEEFEGELTTDEGMATDDDEWMLAVQATLPLFQGGGRHFAILRARAQLDTLEETRQRAAQLIEQRARTAFYAISSSYPNLRLQQTAADYAAKNFDVIQDKYAQGSVSILDLLDAQNQSFVANQNAAIAVYSFLADVMEVQRSMAWFELDHSDEEKDAWVGDFAAFKERIQSEED
jgi:outer membrane protein TolC